MWRTGILYYPSALALLLVPLIHILIIIINRRNNIILYLSDRQLVEPIDFCQSLPQGVRILNGKIRMPKNLIHYIKMRHLSSQVLAQCLNMRPCQPNAVAVV
jgi:hypothetical protein